MENITGVYFIINAINNKVYVGSSTDCIKRKRDHFRLLKSNKHDNSYLQRSWNKYGEENFLFHIVERNISLDQLFEREIYWINYKHSIDHEFGYNMNLPNTNGGSTNHLEETREKLRRLAYKKFYGITSEEDYLNWKQQKEEFKLRPKLEYHPNCNTLLLIDKNTNQLISEFRSGVLTAKHLNCTIKTIDKAVAGIIKSVKGFIVMKKELYDPNKDYRIIPKYKLPKIVKERVPFKGHPITTRHKDTGEIQEFSCIKELCNYHQVTEKAVRKVMSISDKDHLRLKGIYIIQWK